MTSTLATTSTDVRGSTRWMAIELWPSALRAEDSGGKHTKQTDVWAFGMVVYVGYNVFRDSLLIDENSVV